MLRYPILYRPVFRRRGYPIPQHLQKRTAGWCAPWKTKPPKDLNDKAYMKADALTGYGKINFIPFGAICGEKANYNGTNDQIGDDCACQRLSGGPQGQFSNDHGFLIPPPAGYKGSKVSICKYNGQNGLADECGNSIRDFTGKLPKWSVNSLAPSQQAAQLPYMKAWQKEYFGSN